MERATAPVRDGLTGSAAFVRAVVWGGAAALGSAAILAGILLTIGAVGRILMAIAIGWAVGTAIRKANGGYPGRHYQILAAVLTYFAIGLGLSGGAALEVTGPHKVGSGAIAPAF